MKKVISLFLALTMLVALFPLTANAAEEKDIVVLDVGKSSINIFPTYYNYNGTDYTCDASKTEYIITGNKTEANNTLNINNTSDTAASVAYDVTLKDVRIVAAQWCSVVRFGSGTNQGTKDNLIVNLSIVGTCYFEGYNHPGLGGNATVNIVYIKRGSSLKCTTGYGTTYNSLGSNIVLNILEPNALVKVGNVAGAPWTNAYSNKPLEIYHPYLPVTINTGEITATEGQTLSDVKLELLEGSTPGTIKWLWDDEEVGEYSSDPKQFFAIFTPTDSENYGPQKTVSVYVLVKKAPVAAPGKTKIVKLTKGKKRFTVKWKKVAGADGYIIQYSLKKNMKKAKTVKVKKGATVKKTVKKLKAGKKYYVKVCAYKKNGKKVLKGKWSAKKSVKVK